jgi:hypothetical protein
MAEDWSLEEVEATVADYLAMLEHELRGESYNKKEHNRRLSSLLHGRSAGAIEFKHANVSAVLLELGYPYIDGYKPRSNYQELLRDVVASRLAGDTSLAHVTEQIVDADAPELITIMPVGEVIVPAPVRERAVADIRERRVLAAQPQLGINYLEREARNASLGGAGEDFALQTEHRRLWEAGRGDLADRIEHVSRTKGDGLGYDILSFDITGVERLIEVKTTSFGAMTPFFASKREVTVSEAQSDRYCVYRVFKFRELPRMFILSGSLRATCVLDPVQFRASVA